MIASSIPTVTPGLFALTLAISISAIPAHADPAPTVSSDAQMPWEPEPALPRLTAAARDPESLPGDGLPPPLAVILAPQHVLAPPPPPLPSQAPAPSTARALAAVQAALERCRRDGHAVAAAVTDAHGVMLVGIQADGAGPGHVYNAVRKALVSVAFGVPSAEIYARLLAGDPAILKRIRPNMTLFAGALPLVVSGREVGAIAVSGAPEPEIDAACAAAGATAFAG